jgi:Spy/CpxP family protein refolding chaperone
MKRLIGVLVFAFCVLAAGTLSARADQEMMAQCNKKCMHDEMKPETDLKDMLFQRAHFILDNAVKIELSDEQADKVKAIKYTMKKALIMSEADIASADLDVKEGLGKDEFDVNALNTLIDKEYAIKAQQAKDLVAAYADLNKVLTKDQEKKLKSLYPGGIAGKMGCIKTQKEGAGPMMGEDKAVK